LKSIRLISQVP